MAPYFASLKVNLFAYDKKNCNVSTIGGINLGVKGPQHMNGKRNIFFEINFLKGRWLFAEKLSYACFKLYLLRNNFVTFCLLSVDYEFGILYNVHHIMNNSDPSMGDNNENMGLQKIEMNHLDTNSKVFPQDLDILTDMCPPNSEIEEEIFKAFKNMSDINRDTLFPTSDNILETPAAGTTENMLSISDDAIPNNFTLFNDVNDMDIVEQVATEEEVSCKEKYNENKEHLLMLERKIQRCVRRLRMKQSRLLSTHVREQVSGLLDHRKTHMSDTLSEDLEHDRVGKIIISDKLITPVHTSSEPSSESQSSPVPFSQFQYFGSESGDNSSSRLTSLSPSVNYEATDNVTKVTSNLRMQTRLLESSFDSDATASSSGNDSLDEEPATFEEKIVKIPLKKRAVWKWLHERAGAAYRTAWLHSQISDLECKIRQYTDIYRRMRNTKSKVILQNKEVLPTALSAVTDQSAFEAVTSNAQLLQNKQLPAGVVVNGYHGPANHLNHKITRTCSSEENAEEAEDVSRTRPFIRDKFQKRKLVNLFDRLSYYCRASPLNGNNSKIVQKRIAPASSAVRCNCVPPLTCILCITDKKTSTALYHHRSEITCGVASVDSSYHPVLSYPSCASVGIHVSGLLKKPETFERLISGSSTHSTSAYASSKLVNAGDDGSSLSQLELFRKKRKYTKRQGSLVEDGSLRKNSYDKLLGNKTGSYKKYKKRKRKLFKLSDSDLEDDFADSDVPMVDKRDDLYSSQPNSPYSTHSSGLNNRENSYRRKRANSFDIDNFIIPPSSLQSTVVLKPKYKEILIPRWNVVDDSEVETREGFGGDKLHLSQEVFEELNFDAELLHEKLEIEERQKFRMHLYKDKANGQHHRSRKRTDSCPEIVELNGEGRVTPVFQAPETAELKVGSTNTTPVSPKTPFEFNGEDGNIPTTATCSGASKRGRTVSSSSKGKVLFSDCDSNESLPPSEVQTPYESRTFPLPDDVYEYMVKADQLFTTLNENHYTRLTSGIQKSNHIHLKDEVCRSRLHSPTSESTTESVDPTDPDWLQEFIEKEQMLVVHK